MILAEYEAFSCELYVMLERFVQLEISCNFCNLLREFLKKVIIIFIELSQINFQFLSQLSVNAVLDGFYLAYGKIVFAFGIEACDIDDSTLAALF